MRRIKTIAIECLSICDLDRLFFFSRPGVVARFGGWRPFRCVCFPLPEVFGISGFWGVWRAVRGIGEVDTSFVRGLGARTRRAFVAAMGVRRRGQCRWTVLHNKGHW